MQNVGLPIQHPDTNSSWHLFVIKTENRHDVYEDLKKQGIQTQVHYIPVNSQPYYKAEHLPQCKAFYEQCLSLPIYFDLTVEDYKKVVKSFG